MESKTTGKDSGEHIWNTTFERQTRDHQVSSGTQHFETRLGKNRATDRRHLEEMGRPVLGDKSKFWRAIGRQLGTYPSGTNGKQLELEETAPQSKTNELPQGETNELETASEPDTTSQTGRQTNRYMGRQMNWRQPQGRTPPARLGNKSVATKGKKINWRQPKSRTPLARLGDKCIATRGNKLIENCRRRGHNQPSWIETGRKPDATSQTGRQMNCHKREPMEDKSIATRDDK